MFITAPRRSSHSVFDIASQLTLLGGMFILGVS